MKTDLKDVTFAIPVRIDSQDRFDNLQLILDYITHHFDTNIIIVENDKETRLNGLVFPDGVKYIFQQNDSDVFHRTKILNDILEMTTTPYWFNYDCDVLFPVVSYMLAVDMMRKGSKFVFPYQGPFHEIPRSFIPDIEKYMEVNWIDLNKTSINHPSSVGGAMIIDTEIYKSLGGEPEPLKRWGYEDNLRYHLFNLLGYRVERTGTVLYHLEHWRGVNSSPNNEQYHENLQIYAKTLMMNKEDLIKFTKTYSRFK